LEPRSTKRDQWNTIPTFIRSRLPFGSPSEYHLIPRDKNGFCPASFWTNTSRHALQPPWSRSGWMTGLGSTHRKDESGWGGDLEARVGPTTPKSIDPMWLWSIRPTRASRPSDASVDPTEARKLS
jgi:hypothetical protein